MGVYTLFYIGLDGPTLFFIGLGVLSALQVVIVVIPLVSNFIYTRAQNG